MNDPEFKKFTTEELNPLPKATGPFFGYAVGLMEHERSWGFRYEGYFIFASEQEALAYINEEIKDRNNGEPVPDCYWTYNKIGYQPISTEIYNKINKNGRAYVDHLRELK